MRAPHKTLPSWAARIETLRKRLGISQIVFSQRIGVAQSAVSNWEKGNKEPGADTYLQLGKIAGDPECWFFWERAGLSKTDIMRALPDLEDRLFSRGETKVEIVAAPGATHPGSPTLKKRPDAVAVPLLKDAAAAGSPRMIEEAQVERIVVADRHDCPHPQHTTCIRVAGRSMYPVLDDGYIVAVDTFDPEPERLVERMVAARDPDGGITVKWLRKVGDDYMLIPQHTAPEYPPALISRGPGWKIVGEVIWWIGRPK